MLERDTKVAMLAEWRHGAAAGADHAIYVTVSTGIGGAIVVDGHLVDGPDLTAGEIGHLTVELMARPTGRARRDTWRASPRRRLARDGEALVERGEAPGLARLASDGVTIDAAAVRAAPLTRATRLPLADRSSVARDRGDLSGLVNVLNPEVIVLGGAIADHRPGPPRRSPRGNRPAGFPIPAARVRVEASRFGDNVSLVGCWPLIHDPEVQHA